MPRIFDLACRFDSRRSFYGKATIMEENGTITLLSYCRPAARITNGKLEKLEYWNYSATTRRHCREFVRQFEVEDQI